MRAKKRAKSKIVSAPIPVERKPGVVKAYEFEIGGSEFAMINADRVFSGGGARHVRVKKSSAQAKDTFFSGDAAIPPISFENIAQFLRVNTWHRRCVNLKARMVAGLGWNEEEAPAKFVEFAAQCNESGESLLKVLEKFQKDKYSFGNRYLELVPTKKGDAIAEVYHAPAHTMRVLCTTKGVVYGYEQFRSGQYAYFWKYDAVDEVSTQFTATMKNEMLHEYDYSTQSDFYGEPDVITALQSMTLDASALKFNLKAFENELVISFAILVKGGTLGAEGIKSVQSFLKKNFAGLDNTRRVLLLESSDPSVEITIEKISADVKDASFRFLRADIRDEILSAHAVPPRLAGVVTSGQLGGGSEAAEQFKIFKESVIEPDQTELETIVNTKIVPRVCDPGKWKFKLRELDIRTDAAIFEGMLRSSSDFTSAEIREQLGYAALLPDDPNAKKKALATPALPVQGADPTKNQKPPEPAPNDDDPNVKKSVSWLLGLKKMINDARESLKI